MPIVPLPQFELDLEEDRQAYEKLKPPTSVVVRFGALKMIGEFPFSAPIKPGCGTKFVVRTHRGTELGEMLTSTCPNAGCSKSVSRKEMLEYIDNSGGKDYPFFTQGAVLRVATAEDLAKQATLDAQKPEMIRFARYASDRIGLQGKIVDVEPLLGGERITFHFVSEERIDFRELVMELAGHYHTRIEMHQVGARDEARLTADYEKCGQHCCCKQFLKVLKPVSMKAAKTQKATLDPIKISGRCGRLMCCLRYEETTYDELKARLPKKKTRVKTQQGWGIVIDSQILTQLILIRLDATNEDIAVAVEEVLMSVPAGAALPPGEHDVFRDGPLPPPAQSGPGQPGGSAQRGSRQGAGSGGPQPPRQQQSPQAQAHQRSTKPTGPTPPRGVQQNGPNSGPQAGPQSGPSRPPQQAQRHAASPSPSAPPPQSPKPPHDRADEFDTDIGPDDESHGDSVQETGQAGPGQAGSGQPGEGQPRRKRRRRRRRGGGGTGGASGTGDANGGPPTTSA